MARRTLVDRLHFDSIAEFRGAATQRFSDGVRLQEANHGFAAIYVWGYAVEMTLKAAFFHLDGYAVHHPVTMHDLRDATGATATRVGFIWPPKSNFHDVESWARLIVAYRSAEGLPYGAPRFGDLVIDHAKIVYAHWREYLRYHKNRAHRYEVAQVQSATLWLLNNSDQL